MRNYEAFITLLASDKALHFLYGFFLVSLFWWARPWQLVLALALGPVKEIVDGLGFGTPDAADAIATDVGGLLAVFITLLINGQLCLSLSIGC